MTNSTGASPTAANLREDDALLTIGEVAKESARTRCHPALLAPHEHRTQQLPSRPRRPLLAQRRHQLAEQTQRRTRPARGLTTEPCSRRLLENRFNDPPSGPLRLTGAR